MIRNAGTLGFEDADEMNVPVDLWLTKIDDDDRGELPAHSCPVPPTWKLTASNYTPRKGRIEDQAYYVLADNREELAALVLRHVMPLYAVAFGQLASIVNGTATNLYYWEREDADERERATPG